MFLCIWLHGGTFTLRRAPEASPDCAGVPGAKVLGSPHSSQRVDSLSSLNADARPFPEAAGRAARGLGPGRVCLSRLPGDEGAVSSDQSGYSETS